MPFKERIKQARVNMKMTQEQLGIHIGVAKSTITGYEKGNSEPDVMKIQKIMDVLNVDANFLFQDEMRLADTQTPPIVSDGGRIGKDLSFSAIEVATAYEAAAPKDKRAVRAILELAPLEEEAEAFNARGVEAV